MWKNFIISIVAGVFVTIAVLLTRILFYRIKDLFPSGALFNDIKGSLQDCLIFIVRMKDKGQSGEYITPQPQYSPRGEFKIIFEKRQLTPWVTSIATIESVSMILNVLGQVGRSNNIEITYADKDHNRWDTPMFIVGGNWKFRRAQDSCGPYFKCKQIGNKCGFTLIPKNERFEPDHPFEEDMGLLQKMINPTNGLPVWVIMGIRGAGTSAAAYALVRWWRYLGWLYGKRPFGILVGMNDKDGWQQSGVVSIYPKPTWLRRISHPFAWYILNKKMRRQKTIEN